MTFFRAMALYPEVLHRAQKEIDQAVGTERLPSFRDREKLPYINALIKEIIRWESVVPTGQIGRFDFVPGKLMERIGVPHVVTDEESYDGYRITKNALILPNTWYVWT